MSSPDLPTARLIWLAAGAAQIRDPQTARQLRGILLAIDVARHCGRTVHLDEAQTRLLSTHINYLSAIITGDDTPACEVGADTPLDLDSLAVPDPDDNDPFPRFSLN